MRGAVQAGRLCARAAMSQQRSIAIAAVALLDRKEQPCPRVVAELINPYLRWVILRRYIPVLVDECPLRSDPTRLRAKVSRPTTVPFRQTVPRSCRRRVADCSVAFATSRHTQYRGRVAVDHFCSSNPPLLGWGTDSGSLLQLECSAAAHRRQCPLTTTAASTGYLPTWLRGVRVGGRPLPLRRLACDDHHDSSQLGMTSLHLPHLQPSTRATLAPSTRPTGGGLR